jgi:type IV pilus assembly protein PilC
MPYYKCTFVSDRGARSVRVLEALGKEEIWEKYRSGQQKLMSVRRTFPLNVDLGAQLSHRIKPADFFLFNQKLIALINAGVPLVQSLGLVLENTPSGTLKVKMEKARDDLSRGASLRDAFDIPQLPYGRIYRAALTAGERSGQLENLLRRFNEYLSKMVALRRRIVSSMVYPIFVLFFVIALAMMIIMVVVPKFSSFFQGFNTELPPVTKLVVNLGNTMKAGLPIFVVLVALTYLTIRILEKSRPGLVIIDRLKLRLPLIGTFITENALAAFSRTLSILLNAGIPLPESLGVALETFGNRKLRKDAEPMRSEISEGQLFSALLVKIPWMQGMLLELVRVGESSGNLGAVLDQSADHYESRVDNRVATLVSMIEPMLLAVISVLVGLVIFSVYLPIFSAIQVVQ